MSTFIPEGHVDQVANLHVEDHPVERPAPSLDRVQR